MKYKIEFIINCVTLVPYDTWINVQDIEDIDPNARSRHAFFLLCPNTDDGFPVGINKDEGACILLDNGKSVTLERLKQLYMILHDQYLS